MYSKGSWQLDTATGEISTASGSLCKGYGATMHNYEDNAAECMANARLIENAPKMLHALRKARSVLALNVYSSLLAEDIGELIDCIDDKETRHD